MICVFAIATGTPARRLPDTLRAVPVGSLTAIVSDTRRAPAPTSAQLRKYHQMIAELADTFPALIPARFGTLLRDSELAPVLQSRARSLSTALRHVRGRVQMTVRVVTPVRPAARSAQHRSGTAYLRELAARERAVPGFDPVRDAVKQWVRDERIDRTANVTTVYHLIPRRSSVAYRRVATVAAAHAPVPIVISGPFPPYAFSTL